MSDLYTRAMRNELQATLTVAELAQLRASSFGGVDQVTYSRLLLDITGRIAAGRVTSTPIEQRVLTDRWLVRRPYDPDRDSPLSRGQIIESECSTSDGRPPSSGAERIYDKQTEIHLSRAQSQTLFAQDPDNWSEGSRVWAGVPVCADIKQSGTGSMSKKNTGSNTVRLIDDARIENKLRDAEAVCKAAKIDPHDPIPPASLYPAISVPLKSFGYTPTQMERVKKNPNRLPSVCKPMRGKHTPIEVVFHILTSIVPERPPDRNSLGLSVASVSA